MKTLTITYQATPPAVDALAAFQQQAGIQLPAYLVDFMLQYGGAEVSEHYWNEHTILSVFLLPHNPHDASMEQILPYVRNPEYVGRNDLIPFAVDIAGRPFYVSTGAADNGAVYIDRVGMGAPGETLLQLADSFGAFIDALQPEASTHPARVCRPDAEDDQL